MQFKINVIMDCGVDLKCIMQSWIVSYNISSIYIALWNDPLVNSQAYYAGHVKVQSALVAGHETQVDGSQPRQGRHSEECGRFVSFRGMWTLCDCCYYCYVLINLYDYISLQKPLWLVYLCLFGISHDTSFHNSMDSLNLVERTEINERYILISELFDVWVYCRITFNI